MASSRALTLRAATAWRVRTSTSTSTGRWPVPLWVRGTSTAVDEQGEAADASRPPPPPFRPPPRLPAALVTLPTSLQAALVSAATAGPGDSLTPRAGPRVGGPLPSTPTRRAAGRLLKRDAADLAAALKAAARSTGRGGSLALPWAAQGVARDEEAGLSPSSSDEEGEDDEEAPDWSSNDGDDEASDDETPWSDSEGEGTDGGAPPSALLVPRLGGGSLDLVAAGRAKGRRRSGVFDKPRLEYGPRQAAAYAAARAPATFAAASHALSALAAARPGWAPVTALDFGAGPGAAAWAARGVWSRRAAGGKAAGGGGGGAAEEPLSSILAVERSPAMAGVGRAVATALAEDEAVSGDEGAGAEPASAAFASAAAPPRFVAALPGGFSSQAGRRPAAPSPSPTPPVPAYDLVLAAYSLGEAAGPDAGVRPAKQGKKPRAASATAAAAPSTRLALDLWARVAPGGALVLLEPGTPAGSAAIRAARAAVLEAAGPGAAHVAAPCPHDGPCPLDSAPRTLLAAGEAAAAARGGGGGGGGGAYPSALPPPIKWCHFRQRYARPPLTRAVAAAMKPGGRGTAAGHADERFSYVAVVRGGRPPPPTPGGGGEEARPSPARLVRPPRRRRGHVLLDVCAGTGAFGRVTVTVGGGKEEYKAARGAGWGGVW